MWKDCNMVMLPTDKKANIFIRDVVNGRELFHSFPCLPQTGKSINSDVIAQHFYVASDEDVKESDLPCYVIYNKSVQFITDKRILFEVNNECSGKIIATTDDSLKIKTFYEIEGNQEISLPQPSQQFIQHFIKEYNKGNVISTIQVEYGITKDDNRDFVEFLWIAPENTINIKPIKDSWSREEVEKLLNSFADTHKLSWLDPRTRIWIKENL